MAVLFYVHNLELYFLNFQFLSYADFTLHLCYIAQTHTPYGKKTTRNFDIFNPLFSCSFEAQIEITRFATVRGGYVFMCNFKKSHQIPNATPPKNTPKTAQHRQTYKLTRNKLHPPSRPCQIAQS